ncbi:MAG: hypothetical protein Q8Q01_02445 [archaeon]|nr:hypothetical protein [archaeon]
MKKREDIRMLLEEGKLRFDEAIHEYDKHSKEFDRRFNKLISLF